MDASTAAGAEGRHTTDRGRPPEAAPDASAAPHLRRLLDLLAADAPAEALGAVTGQAREAGVGGADLAETERAVATALRVRSSLRAHRRRELELAALFDTAGDLAASRDLDEVLKAIVRRARMLLGTDTAYLTLPDEEAGDTYMRVTDGSVSPVFQNLRLELGEGLGGLVAQTTRPYATPDYRTDDRFRHTRNINAGVFEEGLVAILGVPLLLGSVHGGDRKVIGVLFAADRTPARSAPTRWPCSPRWPRTPPSPSTPPARCTTPAPPSPNSPR